ncbi:hypothetical protein ABE82_26120 (plasmid) [Paenibacillus peoriae]|uniref:hypothetical protein n=1 Tax=Paenibacillus peoriae TaxID=59893 RepID=UPI000722DA17|nr:hypothetical protein [Paenibacillus peoriae]ALS09898.1 hypothetical protein ABE82_26120 [Paenibacillus peoriae]
MDKRKARRLKRRTARKTRFMGLDEGHLHLRLTNEQKDHLKRLFFLSNQHLLNDKNEFRQSATVTQSINDFL